MGKKICFITTTSVTLKSFVIPTAIILHEKLGVDVSMICDFDSEFEKTLPDYIHYIPVSMKRGINISGFSSILKLKKIFTLHKFDIVQYSTPNAALYASIAARLAKVPIRLYGQWGIRYVGFNGINRKIFKYLEKICCVNSTTIRSVSPLNMNFGIEEGLYKHNKVKVIGNGGTIGVDLKDFDLSQKGYWRSEIRRQYGISESDYVFGFCGRISADKGCKELLQSFKNVFELHNNSHILMIGSIESNCNIPQELMDWAQNCKNVHFCGPIKNTEISHYYSALDILIHPTYREGFGMVIQEAGAMAVPVVTTRIPGASEVMVDNESCLLVRPKSSRHLTSVMNKLLNENGLSAKLGDNAFKRTEELYSRPIMLANQLADYENLFSGKTESTYLILSACDLRNYIPPRNVKVKRITNKNLRHYEGDKRVVAVIGSRALAAKIANMEFPSLKLFQLTSAGFDNVPIKLYANRGVMVCNAGNTYSIPIAETVVYGILQFAKRIRKNPNNRTFKLFRHYDTICELEGKKVLIMGAGNIGTSIARRLIPFGVKIDAYDPFCGEKSEYLKILRTREQLLDEAYKYDYIISTLPDNESTKGFINAELIDEFNVNSVFVNVGRKAVYVDADLYKALKNHKIRGAILDIFQIIPNPFTNKFRRLSNVIVWPGLTAISCEVKDRLNQLICNNIDLLINHKKVTNVINGVKNVV